MSEKTLQELFGANAAETETTITITKADFESVGLTVSAQLIPERFIVALLLKWKNVLSQASFDTNLDQSLTFVNGGQSLAFREVGNTRQTLIQDSIFAYLHRPQADQDIDPDFY